MFLVYITVVVIAFYLVYELLALTSEKKLITTQVRDMVKRYPPAGFLIGFGMGLLSGHFFWCLS